MYTTRRLTRAAGCLVASVGAGLWLLGASMASAQAPAVLSLCVAVLQAPEDERAALLAEAGFMPDADPRETYRVLFRSIAMWGGRSGDAAEGLVQRSADGFVEESDALSQHSVRSGDALRIGPVVVDFPDGTFPATQCHVLARGTLSTDEAFHLIEASGLPVTVNLQRLDPGFTYVNAVGSSADGMFDLTVIAWTPDGPNALPGTPPVWVLTVNHRPILIN